MREADLQIEHFEVPYPSGSRARLELIFGARGQVCVCRGAEDTLVAGTVEYDVEEWKPEVQHAGETVRVLQALRPAESIKSSSGSTNKWYIEIGRKHPVALEVAATAKIKQGYWDLGGLPLTQLRMAFSDGHHVITFGVPNPEEMESLELRTGASDVHVEGLLNARFKRMDVKSHGGSIMLRFSGQSLSHDAQIKIVGAARNMSIFVARGVPTRVKTLGLGVVRTSGEFVRNSGHPILSRVYSSPAYEKTQGPRLDLDISLGFGIITLASERTTATGYSSRRNLSYNRPLTKP